MNETSFCHRKWTYIEQSSFEISVIIIRFHMLHTFAHLWMVAVLIYIYSDIWIVKLYVCFYVFCHFITFFCLFDGMVTSYGTVQNLVKTITSTLLHTFLKSHTFLFGGKAFLSITLHFTIFDLLVYFSHRYGYLNLKPFKGMK